MFNWLFLETGANECMNGRERHRDCVPNDVDRVPGALLGEGIEDQLVRIQLTTSDKNSYLGHTS
jgi:hypothetical protein